MKRAIVLIALAAAPVFADDVYLRGGGQITGQILSQDDESVTVDIGGGTITARMETVVRIEKGASPLQEYRARAAAIADEDVEAWRELARWAQNQALSSQAAKAWNKVLTVLPDDEEANTALGFVRLDGRWVTQDEAYRARGYVQFEGEWMTPAEQQQILAERQARAAQEEADRRANEARIREIEKEQQEQQQREAEQRARDRSSISWGWGAGPNYWPHYGRVWR